MRTLFWFTCCGLGIGLSVAALAALGDPEGWSLRTDYAKPRAFLVWAPMEDGLRGLAFDCAPGNFFGVRSEDAPEDLVGKPATLLLGAGEARYPIAGEVTKDANTGEVFFTATLSADAKGLAAIQRRLIPLLENSGSLRYAISSGNASTESFENSMPISLQQLRPLMQRFKAVCFGAKK
jgi:hypothetical protein